MFSPSEKCEEQFSFVLLAKNVKGRWELNRHSSVLNSGAVTPKMSHRWVFSGSFFLSRHKECGQNHHQNLTYSLYLTLSGHNTCVVVDMRYLASEKARKLCLCVLDEQCKMQVVYTPYHVWIFNIEIIFLYIDQGGKKSSVCILCSQVLTCGNWRSIWKQKTILSESYL